MERKRKEKKNNIQEKEKEKGEKKGWKEKEKRPQRGTPRDGPKIFFFKKQM